LAGHKPEHYAKSEAIMESLKDSYTPKFKKLIHLKKKREAKERREFTLERRLKNKIIGQEPAIATVASG